MAIQWQLTLSDSQIALLQLINDWELDPKNLEVPKAPDKDGRWMADRPSITENFSHFVMHIRGLLREGLVYHETERYGPTKQYAFNRYGLTTKGEHILAAIQVEVQEMKDRYKLGDGIGYASGRAIRGEVEAARKRTKGKVPS